MSSKSKNPVLGGEFKPRRRIFSWKTIIGEFIFGICWGLSGQCSVVAILCTGNLLVLLGIFALFIGAYVKVLMDY